MLRSVVSGLAASAVAILIALVGLEFAVRALGLGGDALAQPHPWTGWVLIPNARAEIQNEDPALGKRARVDTDRLGLHDVERTAAKNHGIYRVLVLGDSYVEAVQVPFDSMLTRRLERSLDGLGGRRVEVWNCGVDGYTTSQEFLYLRHVAWSYRPDLVVLCFLSGNDLADAVPQLATSLRNRPFYRLDADTLLLDRGTFKSDPPFVGWLRTHSRLFGWVTTQRRVVMTNLKMRQESKQAGPGIPPALQIYAAAPDSLWSEAWTLTERLIAATRDEARHQGAGFMLVSISNGVQEHVKARAATPGWERWITGRGLVLDEPEQRLARLADSDTLDYVPLLPAFREQAERTGEPLHIQWTGHWNSAGHALAAGVIAERIAARLASGDSAAATAAAQRP
jgi:hypothetical protein